MSACESDASPSAATGSAPPPPAAPRGRTLQLMAELLRKMTTAIPVAAVLADVAALIEASGVGLLCGVMLADPRGELLRLGAAPSLPADYAAGLDGLPIAEGRGCCGTAAA